MKLDGTNPLHLALEAFYGEQAPYPTYEKDGRTLGRRGRWRCPSCYPSESAPHRLTVALDPDGDPPECYHGCSEESIWHALGRQPPRTAKRTVGATQERPGDAANPQRDEISEDNISMGVISKDISKGVVPQEENRDGRVAAPAGTSQNDARARALGIPGRIGSEFRCVLPGHEHSARLIATQRGHWLYECANRPRISLAEVRAALDTGQVSPLSGIASSRWAERLDCEAGLRTPRPVAITPPDGCSEATRKVARGMALFLGLRDERMAGEAFPFARSFIVAYCGVTDDGARCALRVLEDAGVIRRDGVSRRAILWRLVEEPR